MRAYLPQADLLFCHEFVRQDRFQKSKFWSLSNSRVVFDFRVYQDVISLRVRWWI
jgi:hypothetical protein